MNYWYLIRGLLKYSILGPCHWIATGLSFIIVPFIVPFASESGWLPASLYWFQTLDNSLDGDSGWKNEHRPYLDIPYENLSKWQRYVSRVLWLYRNPVYGFEKTILNAEIDPGSIATVYGIEGPLGSRETDPQLRTGQRLVHVINNEGKNFVLWHGWYKLSETRNINWMIGWKLLNVAYPVTQTYDAQICTTFRSSLIK